MFWFFSQRTLADKLEGNDFYHNWIFLCFLKRIDFAPMRRKFYLSTNLVPFVNFLEIMFLLTSRTRVMVHDGALTSCQYLLRYIVSKVRVGITISP